MTRAYAAKIILLLLLLVLLAACTPQPQSAPQVNAVGLTEAQMEEIEQSVAKRGAELERRLLGEAKEDAPPDGTEQQLERMMDLTYLSYRIGEAIPIYLLTEEGLEKQEAACYPVFCPEDTMVYLYYVARATYPDTNWQYDRVYCAHYSSRVCELWQPGMELALIEYQYGFYDEFYAWDGKTLRLLEPIGTPRLSDGSAVERLLAGAELSTVNAVTLPLAVPD